MAPRAVRAKESPEAWGIGDGTVGGAWGSAQLDEDEEEDG